MKIAKRIIVAIFAVVVLPASVLADCSLSIYKNYKVKVSNSDGAVLYYEDYNDKLDKEVYVKSKKVLSPGTELIVEYDAAKRDDFYILAVHSKDGRIEGFVKSTDVTNVNEYSNQKSLVQSDYYTISDTEVRKGPGVLYDVVGTIKANTNISIADDFDVQSFGEKETGSWVYISDGTVSGYIYYETCVNRLPINIGKKVSGDLYWVGSNKNEYGFKFGDKVDSKFKIAFANEDKYYVNLNGHDYYISDEFIAEEYNHSLKLLEIPTGKREIGLTTLNSYVNGDDNSKLNLLEKDKEYKVLYTNVLSSFPTSYNNYYIEINDEIYVLSLATDIKNSMFDSSLIVYDEVKNLDVNKDYYYGFKALSSGEEKTYFDKNMTLNAYNLVNGSEEVSSAYYNDQYGFIYSDLKNANDDATIIEPEDNSKQQIIYYAAGAAAFAIVVAGALLVVNKKKKSDI